MEFAADNNNNMKQPCHEQSQSKSNVEHFIIQSLQINLLWDFAFVANTDINASIKVYVWVCLSVYLFECCWLCCLCICGFVWLRHHALHTKAAANTHEQHSHLHSCRPKWPNWCHEMAALSHVHKLVLLISQCLTHTCEQLAWGSTTLTLRDF